MVNTVPSDMSSPIPQRLPFRNSDLIAMVLIALGVVIAGSWLIGQPLTVRVGLDSVGMTMNAAVSFIIAGLALSFRQPSVRVGLAVLLAIPSALTLCEHSFKIELGIDRLLADSWILRAAPHQGRMAPQVATAFALAALALAQLTRPQGSHLHWITPLAIGAIFLIALISFFGRLLGLDIIYDWQFATRIAPHTAVGLLLLSLGLAQVSYRRSFNKADEHGMRSLAHCADEPALEFERESAAGETLYLQVEFAWLDQATRSTLVATVRDLTLLKRGELELRETHERLQDSERLYRDQATRLATLFDSVEDAIVVINASGNIESWNRGAQHLFGYVASDIIGKDARLLLAEPHASQLSRSIQTRDRIKTGRIEMEGRHGSGRLIPIEVSMREMIIDGVRLYVAVLHDISVRREVERMKSEFVSTISHELRTPLTSIAGSLTLIAGGVAGEIPQKAARLVGIARQNSERLIRLINDILDLEKAEAGKLDFAMNVRSLRAEVASVAEFNRGFAQGLGVAIELEEGDDADVLIDSDRLTQVLTNLISNAAKFSPPGGVVRVRIEREQPANVRVTVSDNGPGIPPEFCTRIFQKFAQADASDSRAKGGTGLGLSIAKTITEKLGGRIGFDTTPGKGTSFYIILPVHGRGSLEARSKEGRRVDVEHGTLPSRGDELPQFLHIEDDPSLGAIVREAMSSNAVVTSARSIAAARQQLAAKHFDAVILDITLPDGSGLELLPIATRAGERPPVIISYTADEPSRALRNAVDAALVKSRNSVTQLMVTVLAHVDSADIRDSRRVSSHP